MATLSIANNKAYQDVVGQFSDFSKLSPNKITSIKKVIIFTTDRKSAQASKDFIQFLLKCQKELPLKDSQVNIKENKAQLGRVNATLHTINKCLEVINSIFDGENGSEIQDIQIDDDNMIVLLDNLKKSKVLLQNISDYLTLLLEVQEAKKLIKTIKITYSIDELLMKLNVA